MPDPLHRVAAGLRLKSPGMVFIGDSITKGWVDHDRTLFFGRQGKGIGGNTTAQMRDRFAADVLALRPALVHIMGGTNDLWRGEPGPAAEATLANLAAMAQAARDRSVKVILAAVPPVSSAGTAMLDHADLLAPLNAAIAALCRSAGLIHVDYARALAGPDGQLQPRFTTDGIHLTVAGYRAMRGHVEAAIRASLAA